MDLVIGCVTRNYANFEGRARRMEYWLFHLTFAILAGAAYAAEMSISHYYEDYSSGILTMIVVLALTLPGIAVTARRLHDLNISGWFQLIYLVPWVGCIILTIACCLRGTEGHNNYGPDPFKINIIVSPAAPASSSPA